MQKISLDALAREHLKRARSASSGRSAETVYGGHEHVLRPGADDPRQRQVTGRAREPRRATVLVLRGRVRLTAGADVREAREGDLLIVPGARHNLEAVEDSAVLLATAPVGSWPTTLTVRARGWPGPKSSRRLAHRSAPKAGSAGRAPAETADRHTGS